MTQITNEHLTKPVQVTGSIFNNQLLYFTSTSLLSTDGHLIFLSERFGNPNIYLLDMETSKETQLTFNKDGILKSYVYFDGIPYKGFGKASISVHPQSGNIYFIQDRKICCVNLTGDVRILNEYPVGQMTAFTHVSADGKYLCVPTTDARALDGEARLSCKPAYDIDERIRTENLSSYLRIYETKTGKEIKKEKVQKAWITHVQFSPINNDLILYNNEWPSDCGIRRIWIWNGKNHIPLRTVGEGRSKEDWTCHEMWERNGSAIIYHGAYHNGPAYVGRVLPDGNGRIEISFPTGWNRYGHFTEGKPGMLVTDGYYEEEIYNDKTNLVAKDPSINTDLKKSEISGEWICLLKVDWPNKSIKWIPICRHGSSWESQDSHPHPIFNHKTDKVFFTSDKGGFRSVYTLDVSNINY